MNRMFIIRNRNGANGANEANFSRNAKVKNEKTCILRKNEG